MPTLPGLIGFYDTFWGRRIQKKLQPHWEKLHQQPTVALGFALPWVKQDVLYAIPTQYGGKGVVWPSEAACQTLLVDPLKLPFDNRSVGTIWAMHMLGDMDDGWLDEADRVLYHEGQLHMVVARACHPLTRSWPMARLSKKKLLKCLVEKGWNVRVTGMMGFPSMLWYVVAQKMPYYAVKKTQDGCLLWVQSS